MKIGDKVWFGRAQGEKTLGEVLKVNPKSIKVRQLDTRGSIRDYPVGTVWRVGPSLVTPCEGSETPAPVMLTPKRPDAEILRDIGRIYVHLSPEHLHCDGEISRTAAQRKARDLHARLRTLQAEIGRRVSESEAYQSLESVRWAPAEIQPGSV